MTREEIRDTLRGTGAVAVGFAAAVAVDDATMSAYRRWLAGGRHAGMEYLERHAILRHDPANVLPGVKTVISMAFSYQPARWREASLPVIAPYAYGDDYHDVLRRRINGAAEMLAEELGGCWRTCTDTAPLPERLWAMRAGIGRRGRNGAIIIDGYGSRVFLAELLTTVAIEPDEASERECCGCGACVRRCPGNAIRDNGEIDARRCLSYLTIEHRGDFPAEADVLHTADGRRALYGCDLCLDVCPHNRDIPATDIEEFSLRAAIATLTAEEAASLDQDSFSRIFKGSAIKRAKLAGLHRNAANCLEDREI